MRSDKVVKNADLDILVRVEVVVIIYIFCVYDVFIWERISER